MDNNLTYEELKKRVIKLESKNLLERCNLLESITETAQVIILVLDLEDNILYFNPYMESLSGYKLREVIGCNWFEMFTSEYDRDNTQVLFEKSLNNIQTKGNISPIISKNGSKIFIEWHDKILKEKDKSIIGVLSIGQNITERKIAEDDKKRMKKTISMLEHEATIGNIATGVAHDFNNILASLQGVNLIEKGLSKIQQTIPGKQREDNNELFDSLKHYCNLIKETIELGKILTKGITNYESVAKYEGILKQQLEPHVLKPFDIFKRKFRSTNIKLNFDIEQNLPDVYINGGEIQRIVLNLITNSIQAIEQAKRAQGEIYVKLRKEKNIIKFSIKDNGIGMTDEVKSKIFNHLFTTKTHGTGIGLFTVKKILDSHKIDISIESFVNKGTCFTMIFKNK